MIALQEAHGPDRWKRFLADITITSCRGEDRLKTVIYDSDSIRVIADLCPTKTIVFSFSSYVAPGLARPSYGDGFLQKNGFSAIFVDAKYNHWWQVADFESALAAARQAAVGYERQVSYGNSMGGYGALLAARSLQSAAVTLSPQCVISDASLPLNKAWRAEIRTRPILNDDVRGSLGSISSAIIVIDPRCKVDGKQLKHVADRPSVAAFTIPFATHKVPAFLREIGAIGTVVSALLRGELDQNASRRICRAKRASSPTYIQAIGRACVDTKKLKSLATVVAAARAAADRLPPSDDTEISITSRGSGTPAIRPM